MRQTGTLTWLSIEGPNRETSCQKRRPIGFKKVFSESLGSSVDIQPGVIAIFITVIAKQA